MPADRRPRRAAALSSARASSRTRASEPGRVRPHQAQLGPGPAALHAQGAARRVDRGHDGASA